MCEYNDNEMCECNDNESTSSKDKAAKICAIIAMAAFIGIMSIVSYNMITHKPPVDYEDCSEGVQCEEVEEFASPVLDTEDN